MTTDNSSSSDPSHQSLNSSGTHPRSRTPEPRESYEPEAHHQWFPSERFFFHWFLVSCCGFLALCFVLIAHHVFCPGYRAGDKADREIVATHAITVVDETATNLAREQAKRSVIPVFKVDRSSDALSMQRLANRLQTVMDLQKCGIVPFAPGVISDLSAAEHLALLKLPDEQFLALEKAEDAPGLANDSLKQKLWRKGRAAGTALYSLLQTQRQALKTFRAKHEDVMEQEELLALLVPPTTSPAFLNSIQAAANRVLKVVVRLPVAGATNWQDTAIEFLPESWQSEMRNTAAALMCDCLESNIGIDDVATKNKSEQISKDVPPVMKEITVGQLIVAKNGTISPETIKILQAMGLTDTNRWPVTAALCISLSAAVALVALFLYTFEAKLLFSTRSLALMYTLAVVTLGLASAIGKTYPQIVPLPATALILTIFFGQRAALAVSVPLAIFLAVDRLMDFNHFIALCTAAGAAIGTYNKHRHALSGLVIGMAQSFGFLAALAISQTPLTATGLGSAMGMEFVGGIASSVVAIGVLPSLEHIFGLVTPFRLAELTDADQPLLRKLEENAPGTYQHSLAVANLGEAGARAINADVNLVRAGAFYHDVGKMVRPKYFIENQLGATNPHDSMSPEESRERVLAHVTDGLALAKQYQLPKAVQDFIPMHQGTSLMAYFYHKACLRDGVENVDPQLYRYPGPKPQSKETSIVMLADVSEAVTHSMKNPSEEEVDVAISKVFQNRWDDGQFSESGLTHQELQKVKKAFVRVWRTLHHDRLKYPSTTTGRMAVPPENLPSAAALANIVTGNEFAAELPQTVATAQGEKRAGSGGNDASNNGRAPRDEGNRGESNAQTPELGEPQLAESAVDANPTALSDDPPPAPSCCG